MYTYLFTHCKKRHKYCIDDGTYLYYTKYDNVRHHKLWLVEINCGKIKLEWEYSDPDLMLLLYIFNMFLFNLGLIWHV